MPYTFRLILEVLSALTIVFSMFVVGGGFLNIFKTEFDRDEKLVFSFAFGYGIIANLVFILGVMGLYKKWIAWSLIFFIFIFAIRLLKNLTAENAEQKQKKHKGFISDAVFPSTLRSHDRMGSASSLIFSADSAVNAFLRYLIPKSMLGRVVLFISLWCGIVVFALAFMPPHYYDSLVYHLALPAEYIKNNSIKPLPYNLYSHFPQNAEMIFTLGLLVGNEITANLLTFFTSAIFLFSIFVFIKKIATVPAAWMGVFFVATAPFFMLLGSSTYVEMHIAFFSFVSFWLFMKFLEAKNLKTLLLLSITCGLTIGIKYTGFATLFAINILLMAFFLREKFIREKFLHEKLSVKKAAARFFILNFGAFISSFVWYAKNFIYTGNPVFPFFYDIFGYKNIDWNRQSAAGYFSMLTEYSHKSSVFYEIILAPYNIIFNPIKFGGGIDVLGDFGWIIFLCTTPLFFVAVKEKIKNVGFMISYAAIIFLIWFFTKPVLRFLIPVVGILAVLSAVSVKTLYDKAHVVSKFLLVLFITAVTALNIYYFLFIVSFFRPWDVISGQVSRDNYLSNILRYSPYPAFLFINENMKSDAQILFVGEQRSFYCNAKLVATNVFAPNPLVSLADDSKSADDLLAKIKLQNFTHIFYNIPEGERLRGYGIFNFSDKGLKNWQELLEKLKVIFNSKGLRIYEL